MYYLLFIYKWFFGTERNTIHETLYKNLKVLFPHESLQYPYDLSTRFNNLKIITSLTGVDSIKSSVLCIGERYKRLQSSSPLFSYYPDFYEFDIKQLEEITWEYSILNDQDEIRKCSNHPLQSGYEWTIYYILHAAKLDKISQLVREPDSVVARIRNLQIITCMCFQDSFALKKMYLEIYSKMPIGIRPTNFIQLTVNSIVNTLSYESLVEILKSTEKEIYLGLFNRDKDSVLSDEIKTNISFFYILFIW